MLKPVALAASALVIVALAGCSAPKPDNADDGVVQIVASTNVYGDIAQSVGGPEVEVTSIIDDPSQDPHQFEANARVQLALSRADIVIVNGGGYDDFMNTMLDASGNEAAVLITAVDESGLDTGSGSFNEHVWYDWGTAGSVAGVIADALSTADPAGAGGYDERAAEFVDGLEGLEARGTALRPASEGAGVVVTEPVPGYLLSNLGMVDLTPPAFSEAIEEDADVSPALLQEVLNLLGDGSARVVVFNEQTGGPQTDAVLDIASEEHIPAIGVTETLPEGEDYLSWQSGYLDLLEGVLTS